MRESERVMFLVELKEIVINKAVPLWIQDGISKEIMIQAVFNKGRPKGLQKRFAEEWVDLGMEKANAG